MIEQSLGPRIFDFRATRVIQVVRVTRTQATELASRLDRTQLPRTTGLVRPIPTRLGSFHDHCHK